MLRLNLCCVKSINLYTSILLCISPRTSLYRSHHQLHSAKKFFDNGAEGEGHIVVGGGRGGHSWWGVRIPQTMSRFLIPVLLYLHRLRLWGRPKTVKVWLLSLYSLHGADLPRPRTTDFILIARTRTKRPLRRNPKREEERESDSKK